MANLVAQNSLAHHYLPAWTVGWVRKVCYSHYQQRPKKTNQPTNLILHRFWTKSLLSAEHPATPLHLWWLAGLGLKEQEGRHDHSFQVPVYLVTWGLDGCSTPSKLPQHCFLTGGLGPLSVLLTICWSWIFSHPCAAPGLFHCAMGEYVFLGPMTVSIVCDTGPI